MKKPPCFAPIARREAIKRTIVFSTGLLTAGWLNKLRAQTPATEFGGPGLHLLALGDFGTGNAHQAEVARQMGEFARKLGVPLSGVMALGDNFYRRLTPERFGVHFEEMYSREQLNCPFYACLGNHDYGPLYDDGQGRPKAQMQLDYACGHPASRWKMPAKWYAVELPDAEKPLVKIIFLDGNNALGALTPQEKLDQQRFLEAELKKETRAPWRWMVSHFPLFTQTSKRGDNAKLIEQWGGVLKTHPFQIYLSGHDHNLQHMEVEGYQTSFIVSGSGGAGLYEVTSSPRGYSGKVLGFTHLHVTSEAVNVQFIDVEGHCLHRFRRTVAGKVEVALRG